jgi:hypothetical protein
MSRALGAAFLNHQVEQLEKTVSNGGPASGNWRDRHQAHERTYSPGSPCATATKRGPNPVTQRKKGGETPVDRTTNISPTARKRSGEEERKDADVVVVDASVLVNALYQVKKWCRDGREEIIIVPLEGEYCFFHLRPSLIDLFKLSTPLIYSRRGPPLSPNELVQLLALWKLKSEPTLVSESNETMPSFYGIKLNSKIRRAAAPLPNG